MVYRFVRYKMLFLAVLYNQAAMSEREKGKRYKSC